jgi:hypothetical protein
VSGITQPAAISPSQWAVRQGRFASVFFRSTIVPMRTRLVVLRDPDIEIALQFFEGLIDLLAERRATKLIEHGSMESFADSIGLRALGLLRSP